VKHFFKIGSHELFAQSWLRTMILLISDSQVARITGMNHWNPDVWVLCAAFTLVF
jgi:hypothetical protein